jgi:hypothetical protein
VATPAGFEPATFSLEGNGATSYFKCHSDKRSLSALIEHKRLIVAVRTPGRRIRSARLSRERAIRAIAIIDAISELWPTFVVHKHRRSQLAALGIHGALLVAVAPAFTSGTITARDIRAALRRYVSAEGYLRACRRAGTARIDLTANVADTVSEREAQHARRMLAQRRRNQAGNPAPIAPPNRGRRGHD